MRYTENEDKKEKRKLSPHAIISELDANFASKTQPISLNQELTIKIKGKIKEFKINDWDDLKPVSLNLSISDIEIISNKKNSVEKAKNLKELEEAEKEINSKGHDND